MRIRDWSSDVCSSDLFGPAFRLLVVAMLAPQKGGVPVLTRTGKEHRHQIRKILEAPDHALPLPPRHSASATPSLRGSAPPFHAPSRRSTAFTFDPSSAGVTMWPSAVNRSPMASSDVPFSPRMGLPLRKLLDRKSVVSGNSLIVRVELGGRRH